MLSILIPVLNEARNIDPLLERLTTTIADIALDVEVLLVDGSSCDGTQARVREWQAKAPVRLIQCDGRKGLAGDVLKGAEEARGELLVVMDGDLSHPPEAIPQLLQPLLDDTHDMVIGSRYTQGGAVPDWTWFRRLTSAIGSWAACPFTNVHDPLSGFFAIQRSKLLEEGRHAVGYKIGLEILANDDSLRVAEIPITFRDRTNGKSKFGWVEVLRYFAQLIRLTGHAVGEAQPLSITSSSD